MPIYSPKQTGQTVVNFAHPSVEKLKDTPPNITISKFGLIESDRPRRLITIKNKKSLNGSVAGKDVSVNGTYQLKSFDSIQNFKQLQVNSRDLPDIDQQSGICQTIPFLHMIQNQLDFQMDYDSLWQCIDVNWTNNPLMNFYDIFIFSTLFGIKDALAYPKLFNLLFSPGRCFSVNEIPPKCTDEESQLVGDFEKQNKDCNNPCSRQIRITTKILPNINNEKDLCDRLNNLGPCPLGVTGLSSLKVSLLSFGEFTWEDVKDMDFETVKNLLPEYERDGLTTIGQGHMLTITSCTNGVFTVKDSNLGDKEFLLSWQDIQESFVINPRTVATLLGKEVLSYYPVVEECPSIAKSPECEEAVCIAAGFDGRKYNPDSDECECYCNKALAPVTATNFQWLKCLNAGKFVQKVYGYDIDTDTKRCVCPEHPEPEFYYYADERCCEIANLGSWCERIFCKKTNRYYTNGNTIEGDATKYKSKGEFAVAWERKNYASNAPPRKVPCVKEEMPPICSGSEIDISPSALNFNIQTLSSLRLI